MDLLIDVGNSETVVGLGEPGGEALAEHWRVSTGVPRTADEWALLLRQLLADAGLAPAGLRHAVLGSVVPAATTGLRAGLERLGVRALVVDGAARLPIRLEVDEPRTVGADRIVNTLAAKVRYGRDTVVVDLGTATTFDCITADGVFVGGVIAPGVQAGLDWLARRTAKLPRVEFAPPGSVVGRRTETCMQSGLFYGVVDAVDGIVRRIRATWEGRDPLVVATGGYAELVGAHCDTVQVVEPFLTLHGLALAGEHMAAQT